jgi:hypothetical protein
MPALAQTGPGVSGMGGRHADTGTDRGATEQIRQLVQCGSTMYAVGTFTSISGWNGTMTTTVPVRARHAERSFGDGIGRPR